MDSNRNYITPPCQIKNNSYHLQYMHPLNSPNFEYRIQPSLEAKNNFYWRNLLHYGSHPNFSYNTANNWSYHDPSYFHNPQITMPVRHFQSPTWEPLDYSIQNPPGLDTAQQVHYKFLTHIKKYHIYNKAWPKVPHSLVNYLLKLLHNKQCQYSKTILEFIIENIPNFHQHFDEYQLAFLLQILEEKYPLHLDYSLQYHKFITMGGQAQEFLAFLLVLGKIYYKIQQRKRLSAQREGSRVMCRSQRQKNHETMYSDTKEQNKYVDWLMNYLKVLYQHRELITDLNAKGESEANPSRVQQMIKETNKQIKARLNNLEEYFSCLRKRLRIMQLIYKMLPYNLIACVDMDGEGGLLDQYIRMYVASCSKHNIDGTQQLFGHLHAKFRSVLQKIGDRTLAKQGQSQMKRVFEYYSFKIVNVLGLGIWSRQAKLQLLELLCGFKFICGFNNADGNNECQQYRMMIQLGADMMRQRQNRHSVKGRRDFSQGMEGDHNVDRNMMKIGIDRKQVYQSRNDRDNFHFELNDDDNDEHKYGINNDYEQFW